MTHRLRHFSVCICFCFILGFVQFCFLCLSLCRSSTAHTDINKALLWRLSERTPATAVAVWTEKLLCDFQKTHTKSLNRVWLTVYSLWFSGKLFDQPNNGMLISTENNEQSKSLFNWHITTLTLSILSQIRLKRCNCTAPARMYSSSPLSPLVQLLSVYFLHQCTLLQTIILSMGWYVKGNGATHWHHVRYTASLLLCAFGPAVLRHRLQKCYYFSRQLLINKT